MTLAEKFLTEVKARQGVCPCKRYHCGLCGNQTDTPALAGHADVDRLVAMIEAARDALTDCTDSEYCGHRGRFCGNHTALAELDRLAARDGEVGT